MTQQPLDQSQTALNEAQANQANANAALFEQQALQTAQTTADSKYAALVPDLTKVATGSLDTSNDKGGLASALSFAAMKHAAERSCRSLRDKTGNMSALRILLTSESNLITSSSAGIDVCSELKHLNDRASELLRTDRPPASNERPLVALGAITAAASALPGVLSLFAKHETLVSSTVAPNDLAAVAAVSGALLAEPNGPALKSDTFQRGVRGPLYEQADELASKLVRLQSITGDSSSEDVKDLIKLIENTLAAITSIPKGGTLSPLAAASFWDLIFNGSDPITHILLVKSETGGTAELLDQRAMRSDHVFLAATASITHIQ